MGTVASIVTGLATSFLLIEMYAWLPGFSTWLLERAVRQLALEDRERCREEWASALEAYPNTVVRLCHALSFLSAARSMKADSDATRVLAAINEVMADRANILTNVAALRSRILDFPDAHSDLPITPRTMTQIRCKTEALSRHLTLTRELVDNLAFWISIARALLQHNGLLVCGPTRLLATTIMRCSYIVYSKSVGIHQSTMDEIFRDYCRAIDEAKKELRA